MFEHWKAYKNRQNENLNGDPTTAKHSRAESFASLVSVIRNSFSFNCVKLGAPSRWSFRPIFACVSIETTTIGKMHPTLVYFK